MSGLDTVVGVTVPGSIPIPIIDHDTDRTKKYYTEQTREIERVSGWHIDRTIPLVLIFGIFIQTCGAIWWAAAQTKTTEDQGIQIIELHTALNSVLKNVNERNEEIARIAENIDEHNNRFTRLETIGDSLTQKVDQILADWAIITEKRNGRL